MYSLGRVRNTPKDKLKIFQCKLYIEIIGFSIKLVIKILNVHRVATLRTSTPRNVCGYFLCLQPADIRRLPVL